MSSQSASSCILCATVECWHCLEGVLRPAEPARAALPARGGHNRAAGRRRLTLQTPAGSSWRPSRSTQRPTRRRSRSRDRPAPARSPCLPSPRWRCSFGSRGRGAAGRGASPSRDKFQRLVVSRPALRSSVDGLASRGVGLSEERSVDDARYYKARGSLSHFFPSSFPFPHPPPLRRA